LKCLVLKLLIPKRELLFGNSFQNGKLQPLGHDSMDIVKHFSLIFLKTKLKSFDIQNKSFGE
jgi:hypothetical protein